MSVRKIKNINSEKVNAGKGTSRQILIGPDEAPNFAMRKFVIEPGGSITTHTNNLINRKLTLVPEHLRMQI